MTTWSWPSFRCDDAFDYIYFSTFHWARLINGYSGFSPDSYIKLQYSLEPIFPSDAAVDMLRQRGVTHLTINCAMYRRRNWDCDSALGRAGCADVARARLERAVGGRNGSVVSVALRATCVPDARHQWRSRLRWPLRADARSR